jgi:hypothetical protein
MNGFCCETLFFCLDLLKEVLCSGGYVEVFEVEKESNKKRVA